MKLDQAIYTELTALRSHLDGTNNGTHEAWIKWGYRIIVLAWKDAEAVASVRDALAAEDFSHMTSGHPVSPNCYHVYRRDAKSPSQCVLVASCGKGTPGIDQVIKGHSACVGGERGETSIRRSMRGF